MKLKIKRLTTSVALAAVTLGAAAAYTPTLPQSGPATAPPTQADIESAEQEITSVL